MAMSHHSITSDSFKASPTPLELLLTERHGNLLHVIPQAVNEPGATLEKVASELGVSDAWLSAWLRRNGFVRVTVWQRDANKTAVRS